MYGRKRQPSVVLRDDGSVDVALSPAFVLRSRFVFFGCRSDLPVQRGLLIPDSDLSVRSW